MRRDLNHRMSHGLRMSLEVDKNLKLVVSDEVAIEDFQDKSLVFLAEQLRLIEVNKTAKMILDNVNGRLSVIEVIRVTENELGVESDTFLKESIHLISGFISDGVLIPSVKINLSGELKMSKSTKFMANPDVSSRVEDEDGAILFNPDSDSTQVINPIGLDIWRSIEKHPRLLSGVVSHIKDIYEDAPEDQVEKDVEIFIKDLHAKGFIGEVVDD